MQLKKIISATLLLGLLGSSAVFADVEPNPAETPNPTATDEQSYNSETEPTENTSDDTVPTDLEVLDSLDENYYNQEQVTPPVLKVISLGKSTSNFASSPSNRKFNIKKAANALNGKVIQPGEIFDFNRIVGPTSQATGYRNAKVITDGEFVDGYGGGVCQVSSTLFNAALNSGMELFKEEITLCASPTILQDMMQL